MFYAINKKTGERLNSLYIEENPSYQFLDKEIFVADPNDIDTAPKDLDIRNIIVKFRKGSSDHISTLGKKFIVSPHFFIPNKTKLGINIIPESKEHKLAKNFIYNKIKNKELNLAYSKVTKPFKYTNKINLFELPIDYNKIGIEVSSGSLSDKRYRRADIIIPFIVKHPLLGNGIVIEIQFSKQRDNVKLQREFDWSHRGYSIAWLFEQDFKVIEDKHIELFNKELKISSFASLIKLNNKQFIRNLKYTVQEECRKLDIKLEQFKSSLKNNFKQYFQVWVEDEVESINKNQNKENNRKCPYCKSIMVLRINSKTNQKFWGCGSYPSCRFNMPYREK